MSIESRYKDKKINIDRLGDYYTGHVYDKGCLMFSTKPSKLLNDVAAEIAGHLTYETKSDD